MGPRKQLNLVGWICLVASGAFCTAGVGFHASFVAAKQAAFLQAGPAWSSAREVRRANLLMQVSFAAAAGTFLGSVGLACAATLIGSDERRHRAKPGFDVTRPEHGPNDPP